MSRRRRRHSGGLSPRLDRLANLVRHANTPNGNERPLESVNHGATEKGAGDLALLWRMLSRSRRYALYIPLVFLVSLLATPLALLQPIPLAIAVDGVLGTGGLPEVLDRLLPGLATEYVTGSDEKLLVFAVVATIALAALTQLQAVAESLLSMWVGERLVLDLRADLFDRAQRISLRYHDDRGPSDSTYRIQSDATAIQSLTVGAVVSLVTSTITLVAMVVILLRIDWQLALVALTVAPILAALSYFYKNRFRDRYRVIKQQESSVLGIIQETLGSLRVVKTFGQEGRENERFVQASRENLTARLRTTGMEGAYGTVTAVLTATGTALVLYLGVHHVQEGVLTLGALLIVMNYLGRLYAPIKTIANKMTRLQSSLASAERLFELLDEPDEVPVASDPIPLRRRATGHIEFVDVSYSYDGATDVLRDVAIDVAPGSRIGIAGPTGAGKSTLLGLAFRLFDPTRGEIRLDGIDIRLLDLKGLRHQFSVVLQDTTLFKTSIAQNIAYGRPDAKDTEIVAAARAADIHEFIKSLPDGYNTPVGERGMKVSGGERQRIALARAFLKDSPILLLDEPTSSVDVRTERRIMDALERLMDGRTTLMIAHRLSTLDACDAKFEIQAGRVRQVTAFDQPDPGAQPTQSAGQVSRL